MIAVRGGNPPAPWSATCSAVPEQEVTDAAADEPALNLRSVRLVVPRDRWPCLQLQDPAKWGERAGPSHVAWEI